MYVHFTDITCVFKMSELQGLMSLKVQNFTNQLLELHACYSVTYQLQVFLSAGHAQEELHT